jgi:hypothetical protein
VTASAALGPAFVRDVLRTLGVSGIEIPEDLAVAADASYAANAELVWNAQVSTTRSRISVERSAQRCTGVVAAADLLAMGLFRGTVRPVLGDATLELALSQGALAGKLEAERVVLAFGESARLTLEAASAEVHLDRDRLAYHDLRFRAHGGRFLGEGRIPLRTGSSSTSPLFLRLEEGGAELVEALATLASGRPESSTRYVPSTLGVRGTLDLQPHGALAAELALETPSGTTLGLTVLRSSRSDGGGLDGSHLRGAVAVADLTTALAGTVPAPALVSGGIVVVDLAAHGGAGGPPVVTGWLSATRLSFDVDRVRLGVADVVARLRADARGVVVNALEASVAEGRLEAIASVSWSGRALGEVKLHAVSLGVFEVVAPVVRGRLSTTIAFVKERGRHLRAAGAARLEEAAFPVLQRTRPALARYGLLPPSDEAAAPVTASLSSSEWGITADTVVIDLPGARLSGEMGVSWQRALDGRGEITLDEEYLRTSTALIVPRVFTERIVLPFRVDGSLDEPRFKAQVGGSLGRLLKDNRVSAFVTSAMEEAHILLGGHPLPDATVASPKAPRPSVDLAELQAELAAHEADWAAIAERLRR